MKKSIHGPESISHRLVPIYSARLMIVVSDNAFASRVKRSEVFGPLNSAPDFSALCTYEGANFGLFFNRPELCHEAIAHEVFHVTHRILERNGVEFCEKNHEPFSHLCGWITNLVYCELERMGERVLLHYPARRYAKGEPRIQFSPRVPE